MGQAHGKRSCRECGTSFEVLGELEGWGALEDGGQSRSVGGAAKVFAGQGRKQAQRRNDANQEKRENRHPIRSVAGMGLGDQQADKGDANCEGRNQ